jgi:hypothetical protein
MSGLQVILHSTSDHKGGETCALFGLTEEQIYLCIYVLNRKSIGLLQCALYSFHSNNQSKY